MEIMGTTILNWQSWVIIVVWFIVFYLVFKLGIASADGPKE